MHRLKALRIKRELTQVDVAKRSGMTSDAIYKWEEGTNDLECARVKNVYKLAQVFDVSIEFLMGYSDIK